MSLTGTVPVHPARYTPLILDVVRVYLERFRLPVHDPFAGTGARLGALCDELGLTFTGTDLEPWAGADPRVAPGDSRYPLTYPAGPFVVVTSPVYFANRISSDYVNGPTPTTKRAGRHAYGISRGEALHADNLARVCRPAQAEQYVAGHVAAARHWGDVAIVNVDGPLRAMWTEILIRAGFELIDVVEVATPRLGGGLAGADKRAAFEVVMYALRAAS